MAIEALEKFNNSLPHGWERKNIFENNTGTVEERIVHQQSIYQNESRDWFIAKNLGLIAISQYAFAFESARYFLEGGRSGAQKLSQTWNTYKLSKDTANFNLPAFAKNQVVEFKPEGKALLNGAAYGLAALLCYYDPQITGYEYFFGTATLAMTASAIFDSMGFRLRAQNVFSRDIPKLEEEKVQKLSFVDTVGAFFKGSMSITHFLKMEPIACIDGENYMIDDQRGPNPSTTMIESYVQEKEPKTEDEKKED